MYKTPKSKHPTTDKIDKDDDDFSLFEKRFIDNMRSRSAHLGEYDVENVLLALRATERQTHKGIASPSMTTPSRDETGIVDDMRNSGISPNPKSSGSREPLELTMRKIHPHPRKEDEDDEERKVPKPQNVTAKSIRNLLDMSKDEYNSSRATIRRRSHRLLQVIIEKDDTVLDAFREMSRGRTFKSFSKDAQDKIYDVIEALNWKSVPENTKRVMRRNVYKDHKKLALALNHWAHDSMASKIFTERKARLIGTAGHVRRKGFKRQVMRFIHRSGMENLSELTLIPKELITILKKAAELGWKPKNELHLSNIYPMREGDPCHITAEEWAAYEKFYFNWKKKQYDMNKGKKKNSQPKTEPSESSEYSDEESKNQEKQVDDEDDGFENDDEAANDDEDEIKPAAKGNSRPLKRKRTRKEQEQAAEESKNQEKQVDEEDDDFEDDSRPLKRKRTRKEQEQAAQAEESKDQEEQVDEKDDDFEDDDEAANDDEDEIKPAAKGNARPLKRKTTRKEQEQAAAADDDDGAIERETMKAKKPQKVVPKEKLRETNPSQPQIPLRISPRRRNPPQVVSRALPPAPKFSGKPPRNPRK